MSKLDKIAIKHAALSGRIVLARMGADPDTALESRDAMNEFWQALCSYAFDGKMPEPGAGVEIQFGADDEQFTLSLKRLPVVSPTSA